MNINELFIHSEWVLRIVVATFCGCLVGYERTNRNKEAGIRTHAIISLGSALIIIVSKYGFDDVPSADRARVAAQIVSGIGFLGAGVIFVKHGTISGLTTAAGMWTTSGVGMCIGAGIYDIGIITTILILLLQTILHTGFAFRKLTTSVNIHLEVNFRSYVIEDIQEVFQKNGIVIYDMKMEKEDKILMLDISSNVTNQFNKDLFLNEIIQKEYLKKIYFV